MTLRQGEQQCFGERAAAAVEFDELTSGTEPAQHRRDRFDHALRELRTQFGRSDKIARRSEHGRRVVLAMA